MDPDRNQDLRDRIDALRTEGVLAAACPTCGAEASFHRAFGWLTGKEAERAKADPEILGVPVRDGYVIELFPEVFLWSDPERAEVQGNTGNRVGVLHCDACGHHAKHHLTWPDDLYFRLRVGDTELVSYTREHAEDNLSLLLQVRAVPRILRPFLRDEVEMRMPPALMKDGMLEPTIEALAKLLGVSPEDA
ncbi:MAG: hypothetical protein QNJ98_05985 [Planctomycetota bacterium]|nr:hypothetical protein [Planctomycetota bacterium]